MGVGPFQTLANLPLAAQVAVSSAIGQDQPVYHAAPVAAGVALANPANGFTAELQSGALRISAGLDILDMALKGLGYGGEVQPVGTASISSNGNRVDSNYGTIDEWYINGPGGLEQGFTVAPLPESAASRSLTVELALGGNLTGTVNAARDGLTLTRPDGSLAMGYSGLTACDATGRLLPAALEVRADGGRQDLIIHVDTTGSQGQITIDPFVQSARLIASDGTVGDGFGSSVAVSGNTMVVGADGNNSGQGAAYIFTASGSNWIQVAKLTPSDGLNGNSFGTSVAISSNGTTVAVGADFAATGISTVGNEAVYVFAQSSSGWASMTQTAKLTAPANTTGDFGRAVAVSATGNIVVVGAPQWQGSDSGAAYVFTQSGVSWTSTSQSLKLSQFAGPDDFGASVSISGSTMVIGAPGATVNGNGSQGAAYVFTLSTSWTQVARLTASDGTWYDNLGDSVAISGTTIVAGAYLNNGYRGAAYVFTQPGAGWSNMTQTAKLTAFDGTATSLFGSAVSVSGNTVVVTAGGFSGQQGATYVFNKPGAVWTDMSQLANVAKVGSVSIYNSTLAIGVAGDSQHQGATYVYAQGQAAVPVVGTLSPTWGAGAGGTTVTITGSGFTGVAAVDFGGVAASSFTVVSDTQITATTPAGLGVVYVTVTGPGGTSSASSTGRFTYLSLTSIAGLSSAGEWWVAKSTGTSFVNQDWGGWNTGAGWQNVQAADVNGDGKADIIGRTNSGAWYVAVSTGSIFVTQYWGGWDPSAGWQDVHFADVNGDGKADIVGRMGSGAWYAAISTGTSFVNQRWGSWSSAAGWQNVQTADFNGDGKADIVAMTSYGAWYVALSTGTSFATQYWGSWNPSAGWQNVQFGDFNGDGKTDIIGMTSYGGWYASLSTGTSFGSQYWGSWSPTAGWQNMQVADVNNDGKADLIGMTSSGAWYVALSTGAGSTTQYWGGWSPSAGWTNIQMADVNGDARADIIGRTSSGAWYVAISSGTSFVNQYWGGWNPGAGWQPVVAGAFA